ncbi:hypothetical protein FisN_15Lh257 [Fistulifera solaris]|uniref:glutathione gamma-glutamylcysteinyltransferase n=1 Tax=Fistulifera solaris TaxID=1519565 RepID=A0A1Z5JBG1_FISSO|nr:hypothetical protein FisN_15Lh257 [Fistulifera solaris]|eukprot:GAX11327.1 hypothetical protein FisN_15Lh257 [Fistulifera solaris]
MKFTAVVRNDDVSHYYLSEHTRLLLLRTDDSFSSSTEKNHRDDESSSTNKTFYWIGGTGSLLLLLCGLFFFFSTPSTSSTTTPHSLDDEATILQLLRHWDAWGKPKASYDMWGKKYTDESTTFDDSSSSSSSSLRPKKSSNSSPADENEEDRPPEDGTKEKKNNINNNNNNNNLHQAQEWAQDTWKNASHEAEQWWQDTDHNRQSTQEWFHQAWNQTSQQAHAVWNHLRQQEQPQIWWNQTMHTEQQWWNQTLRHLHRFGTTVQSWWGQATDETQNEQQVLGQKFQQWWAQANQVERQWWKNTVQASRQFEQVAEQKTGLWWNATKVATGKQWNTTVHQEQVWWNATERWFHDHQLVDGTTAADQPLLYMNSSQAYSMLMNGYGCDALPMDPMYEPHPYATQPILLSADCVHRKVVRYNDTFNGILQFPGGLSLSQARQLLQCHLNPSIWDVTIFHVDPSATTTDQVRRDLQSALKDPNARVLINYDRQRLGQDGGGHFSPLGSYSPQHDAFLIMDVAKYKYPPVWVPTARLVAAMGTIDVCGMWDFPQQQDRLAEKDLLRPDSTRSLEKAQAILGCEERFRGYLIVKRKTE